MSYEVRFAPSAEAELLELYDFLVDRDPDLAEFALRELRKAATILESFPFSCCQALGSMDRRYRELVVPFGRYGYVMLVEVTNSTTVSVLAVRHQREDDYW